MIGRQPFLLWHGEEEQRILTCVPSSYRYPCFNVHIAHCVEFGHLVREIDVCVPEVMVPRWMSIPCMGSCVMSYIFPTLVLYVLLL